MAELPSSEFVAEISEDAKDDFKEEPIAPPKEPDYAPAAIRQSIQEGDEITSAYVPSWKVRVTARP